MTAQIFWLKNRKPNDWRDKHDIEVENTNDETVKEMEAYFAKLGSNKRQALDLLYNEPYRIGQWVGFRDLTEIHNEWLRSFLYDDDDQMLLAHRGSYKTTTLSLFLALAPIVLPRKNVIFFRMTDDDVIEVIRQAKKIMEAGCVQELAKVVWGKKLVLTTDTATAITTGYYDVPKGAEQILGGL